ncbi:hypothetical protein SGFS_065450 [Streptomyces graminofaciens]|uniref:Uncharacterized protein n=1 Tax=Streptomyces graminofaciens TaxID=68212 RepID=A0ABN5VT35_9ACTN|nr:hypothetical protein [Streptomyces graminofaciens]BBC35251.1 hypothetical protein SGFS_065450 [Streptomyces graminofaciens]
MTDPEAWRTDPRERLLAAIDRTWARGTFDATPEQLVDDYAHHLAEQLRTASGSYGSPNYDYELGPGLGRAADLIDPKAQP